MTQTHQAYYPAPPRRVRNKIVKVIGVLGRVFVAAGLLLLFYTAYLLWGTGLYTAQEQERATKELESNPIVGDEDLRGGKIPPARPAQPAALGAALFELKIPKIALDTVVVEGVGREELKSGPGHFPDCEQARGTDCVKEAKYPGEDGNVAISGHRTTYGSPFFKLQELERGDVVDFVSGRVRYRYKVREQKIVDPVSGYSVVEQHGKSEVTLTTCHPRFSAAQRLIVSADYVGASLIAASTPGGGGGGGPSSSQPVVAPEVLMLASIAIGSGLLALGLSKRYRWTAAYLALTVVGAAGLWVGVFPRVLALMPANY